MNEYFIGLFWSGCFFLFFLLIVWLIEKILARGFDWSERLRFACLLGFIVFGLSITIPYHFQGYAELSDPWNQPALGLGQFLPFSLFAFFFTDHEIGLVWLALLGSIVGATYVSSYVNRLILVCLFLFIVFSASQMSNYHIIRAVN